MESKNDVLSALSWQHNTQVVDLRDDPPQPGISGRLPAAICLKYMGVPWLDIGGTLIVATSRPHAFANLRRAMPGGGPALLPVIADEQQIKNAITVLYGAELAEQAATRVDPDVSCRTWNVSGAKRKLWAGVIGIATSAALVAAPLWTLTVAMIWAFATLVLTTLFKACALVAHVTRPPEISIDDADGRGRLPRVSVLVPLLNEKEIAGALITRLTRLTYPKALLDVVLVLEEGDITTKDTLARTRLPPWITVITVPQAHHLMTKPRALNYALDFCKGSIIGVWDAEDAPDPDQLERVVNRFDKAPKNVACLQGLLDYYNCSANWLSRCFTIEYAAWWRILLPGAARLGLVIPLGGTTLFFRRKILEELAGWDAHNVTEDADLGVRLARRGYVTELLPTVTHEEANCRLWPWVRQRSRWLKGFLITWYVHMKNPHQLLRDLGLKRFIGVQVMLFATVSQFACAPLLWSFWIASFGMTHPIEQTLGTQALWGMVAVFIASATLNLGISLIAVSGKEHRHLMWWVFTTPLYFPLGTMAAYNTSATTI